MPIASMTGFGRAEGQAGEAAFVWELRAVNGKGLELRLRLPAGLETLEAELRRLATAQLSRGNVQVVLNLARAEPQPRFAVNEAMLADVLALSDRLVAAGHAVTPTADGILSIRGVIEAGDATERVETLEPTEHAALVAGFVGALDALVASRRDEGTALGDVLRVRLDRMAELVARAEADPARQPGAIVERLRAQLDLLKQAGAVDDGRLAAEAVLLATRADISEELDRLRAHLAAAHALLAEDGPVGRRLDFLSQEFNRETNTICAKSNATSLTAIGLEMKVVVDQFREQVQNIE